MNFLTQKSERSHFELTQSIPQDENPFNNFYYEDVAKLTGAGGWSVNFQEKKSYLDPQARNILKTPKDYQPSLRTGLDFYAEEHKQEAAETFMACSMGTAFSKTVKMVTYDGYEFWAKAIGRPVYGRDKAIIGLQGVFQDINTEKLKELSLEKSIRVIESQNSRLFNFAHIVSHNLRSHASNLQLTLELLNSINCPTEEKELQGSLVDISSSLNTTINHLNEIVSAQSKSFNERKLVSFSDALTTVTHSISRMIEDTKAEIFTDFDEAPEINYITSYLEIILLNLITNSIKYRHPERCPLITIRSHKTENQTILTIKDNGTGIDLEKHGNRVFNMYQTFHSNKESVGIGLFITKNQIETLQGSIQIASDVNKGTTFIIKF